MRTGEFFWKKNLIFLRFKAKNIVDIEFIAWSPLYDNLKIILIFSLYPGKVNQSEWCMQNPEQPIRSQEIW